MAEYIRSVTRNGQEIVDCILDILRNPRARDRDRLAAAQLLQDRHLGKPEQSITLEASIRPAGPALPEPDYENMSLEDLDRLDELLSRAPRRMLASSNEPIDPDGTPEGQ